MGMIPRRRPGILRALRLRRFRNETSDDARRLQLAFHLRMAVGAFQKRRISVAREIGDRLLVHAAVEQSGHVEMPERVEMVRLAEPVAVVELPQVFRERVGMDELPVLVGEQVLAERIAVALCLAVLEITVCRDEQRHILTESDGAAAPVFRRALYHADAGHAGAGAADDHREVGDAFHEEVRPLERAELAAPTAGVDGVEVEEPIWR